MVEGEAGEEEDEREEYCISVIMRNPSQGPFGMTGKELNCGHRDKTRILKRGGT